MTKRILLLAGAAWRDTPGVAAVRVELEKLSSDYEVLIADIHLFPQLAQLYKPHIFTMPHLLDNERNRIVDTLRRRGGLCVVVPNENRPNTDGLLLRDTTQWDTSLSDLYCAWTDTFVNKLSPLITSRVTGCARFDFYADPLD